MQNSIAKKLTSLAAALSVAVAMMPVNGVEATQTNYEPSHTVNASTAKPGDILTYTVKLTGKANSENIVAGTHLSAQVDLVSNSTKATKGTQTVSIPDVWVNNYNFGPLNKDQVLTITYQAKVKANAANGALIETTAVLSSKEFPTKVLCPAKTTVKIEQAANPKYSPSKTVDKAVAQKGDILTYTLKAVNTGNVALTNFYILDQLPEKGVTYIAGSTHLIRGNSNMVITDNWIKDGANTGDLAPGATVTITFKVKVNNDVVNKQVLENVGNFRSTELPTWKRCPAYTKVVVSITPTPTPTPTPTTTPTPTPTATPTPTPTPDCSKEHKADDKCGEVIGATPTPTPIAELPSTGPGMAVVVALASTTAGLISRKYWLAR